MASHRNFHFAVPPRPQDRLGRYIADAAILIGAPVQVVANAAVDADGRLPLELATAAVRPVKGKHGLLIWETPNVDFPGYDPMLTLPGDIATCPDGAPVQLVSGSYIRLRYENTVDSTFYGRAYAGRVMVAGVSIATPTVKAGDLLRPGPGDDDNGYWTETSDQDLAWLSVTAVYDTGVDAQMLF